jgi:hypothetical protein
MRKLVWRVAYMTYVTVGDRTSSTATGFSNLTLRRDGITLDRTAILGFDDIQALAEFLHDNVIDTYGYENVRVAILSWTCYQDSDIEEHVIPEVNFTTNEAPDAK